MNELDDFLCEHQCDEEAYPWGDIAPFDWPEEDEYENDSFWSWIEDYNEEMRSKI